MLNSVWVACFSIFTNFLVAKLIKELRTEITKEAMRPRTVMMVDTEVLYLLLELLISS